MYGLLPDHWPEKRRPSDALRFFEGAVEGGRQRASASADLGRHREDGVERPRRALEQALVRVVRRVEERDEDVAAREEALGG